VHNLLDKYASDPILSWLMTNLFNLAPFLEIHQNLRPFWEFHRYTSNGSKKSPVSVEERSLERDIGWAKSSTVQDR
jgi:hypothetical protein